MLGLASAAPGDELDMRAIPVAKTSSRLLAMSLDESGDVWFGSLGAKVYRYHHKDALFEEIPVPFGMEVVSQAICARNKVYLLGMKHPKLVVFDLTTKKFSELPYPVGNADVWYGLGPIDGQIYLFDRGTAGVISWNTETDVGKAIPYPYKTALPSLGRHVEADGALWCQVWDYTGGQYVPQGLARFDLATQAYTDWAPFPREASPTEAYTDPATTLFYPYTLRGQLMPFDFKTKQWKKALDVPEFGKRFGFIGLSAVHSGRWYFSLSTYNGSDRGVDGNPYHFCNSLLEFDPVSRAFAFPELKSADVIYSTPIRYGGARGRGGPAVFNTPPLPYYQVSYTLSAGGRLFATANNIRELDGTLNGARLGECLVWQSK